jgi:hypothetical protein
VAITLQVQPDGKYCSDLINGRYQILESWLYNDKYIIYDHSKENNLLDSQGSTLLFSGKDNAMKYIDSLSGMPVAKASKVEQVKKTGIKRRNRGESALSYLKELITTTEGSDHDIADKVKERFPQSNYNHSMVKFNRKKVGS